MSRRRGRLHRNDLRIGDNNLICDRSGDQIKASEAREEWNGLVVRADLWEPRHPQDFLRTYPDDQSVELSRNPGEDLFLSGDGLKYETARGKL